MKTTYRSSFKYVIFLFIGFLVNPVGYAFQDVIAIQSTPGDVQLSHSAHSRLSCKSCHHTTTAETDVVPCRKCHLKEKGKVKNAREAFHESCIGCHLIHKKENRKAGPAKLCSECHIRKK